MSRRLIALFSLLLAVGAVFGQAAKPPATPSPPKIEGEMTLTKARASVSKVAGTEAFRIYLETYALALPMHDAVALCKEFLPKALASQRVYLASFAGSLALMAGRNDEAAIFFSQGAESRPDMRIKAARCFLAAGDFAGAKKQLDFLPAQTGAQGKSYETQRQLALSWLYLLDGEPEKAFILLQPMAGDGAGASGAEKREALFLLWMIASSPDFPGFKASTKGFDAESLEAKLGALFADSIELSIVRKGVAVKPAAWLLTGLYAPAEISAAERNLAHTNPAQAQGQGKTESGFSDSGLSDLGASPARLQVGWFARKENAQALTAKLIKLGFAAKTDEQIAQDGQARWAVIVDASGDWSNIQAKLKDQGYESYLLP